ncbi:uncharacterized protein LOC141646340 [Silene latifolia]|uniref:uncharacterized protein LOC141646340 n=1 Tax=Silene latifolia TaxID=37657 RepID=UPI003D77A766
MSPTIVLFRKARLWKLPIFLKWRVFLWKFLANALSLGAEFSKRNLDWYPLCTLCDGNGSGTETESHLFRDCSFAKSFWFGCPLGLRITEGIDIDVRIWFINWVAYFAKCPNSDTLICPLVATFWRIWCYQNDRVFGRNRPSPAFVIRLILDDVQSMHQTIACKCNASSVELDCSLDNEPELSYHARNSFPIRIIGNEGCGNVCTVKCDAAWRTDGTAGTGWGMWDPNGVLMADGHARFFAASPLQAEGLAMVYALRWALNAGFLHILLATDCLDLVLQVVGAESIVPSISSLIQEIESIMSNFHCYSLSFCPRGALIE